MDTFVVGIRFSDYGPIEFAYTSLEHLERQQHVVAEVNGEPREAKVAIAPGQILAAPPLEDVPHVVAVLPVAAPSAGAEIPSGVALLASDEHVVGTEELARALELAARPVPYPPEARSPEPRAPETRAPEPPI